MSEVNNSGRKGRFMAIIFLALFLFVSLWAFVYYSNYNGLS